MDEIRKAPLFKVRVRNLGVLKSADFELGKLTLICGKNNTGKTYATWTLYGFLRLYDMFIDFDYIDLIVQKIKKYGFVTIDINDYIETYGRILQKCCKKYSGFIPNVLNSPEEKFANVKFEIEIDNLNIDIESEIQNRPVSDDVAENFFYNKDKNLITIQKKSTSSIPDIIYKRKINDVIKNILFKKIFPNTFIASAERTGAAIFWEDLNIVQNRMMTLIKNRKDDVDPFELIDLIFNAYPLPIKDNIEFTRGLGKIFRQNGFLVTEHPDIIQAFNEILGGKYEVRRKEQVLFKPHNSSVKLLLDESSSSVHALVILGFYLRHVAQKGDLLMIDEPELNLHPENQRHMARLFARLINAGVNVFVTTHSDYIIKELNTLMMMNNTGEHIPQIMEEYSYHKEELVNADDVRVYIAEERLMKVAEKTNRVRAMTLVPAPIDQQNGAEVSSFDESIIEINRIQDELFFGGK